MSLGPGLTSAFSSSSLASTTFTGLSPSPTPTPQSTTPIIPGDGPALTYPPLTTPWTAPLSCTWTYDIDSAMHTEPAGAVAWLDLKPVEGESTLSCYPSGMFTDGRTGTFSPATCPNGWTTAYNTINANQAPETRATSVVCCSSGYSIDGAWCKRSVPTVLAVPVTYTNGDYEILTNSTTTLYSATIAVHTIEALFEERDKDLLGLADLNGTNHENQSPSSGGLSLAGRIGIGVSITVLGLMALAIAMCVIIRKRRELKDEEDAMAAVYPGRGLTPEQRRAIYGSRSQGHASTMGQDGPSMGESENRNGDIDVLRAQKAAIQRRIDELEEIVEEAEHGGHSGSNTQERLA